MLDLLVEAKKGNKQAFEELSQPIQIKLYKTARAYFFVEEEVISVVKETLKVLFEEIVNVKSEKDLLYLALKFLIEIAEKRIKKNSKKEKVKEKDNNEKNKTEYEIYRRDSLLEGYITSLRKEIRLIAILYFYDELTEKEISNVLQIPERAVSNTVDEVRTKLYEIISNEGVKKYNEYV